jgi:hypothetical protein
MTSFEIRVAINQLIDSLEVSYEKSIQCAPQTAFLTPPPSAVMVTLIVTLSALISLSAFVIFYRRKIARGCRRLRALVRRRMSRGRVVSVDGPLDGGEGAVEIVPVVMSRSLIALYFIFVAAMVVAVVQPPPPPCDDVHSHQRRGLWLAHGSPGVFKAPTTAPSNSCASCEGTSQPPPSPSQRPTTSSTPPPFPLCSFRRWRFCPLGLSRGRQTKSAPPSST